VKVISSAGKHESWKGGILLNASYSKNDSADQTGGVGTPSAILDHLTNRPLDQLTPIRKN